MSISINKSQQNIAKTYEQIIADEIAKKDILNQNIKNETKEMILLINYAVINQNKVLSSNTVNPLTQIADYVRQTFVSSDIEHEYKENVVKYKAKKEFIENILKENALPAKNRLTEIEKINLEKFVKLLDFKIKKILFDKKILDIATFDLKGIFKYRISVLIKNLNKNLIDNPILLNKNFTGITLDKDALPTFDRNDTLQDVEKKMGFLYLKRMAILSILGPMVGDKAEIVVNEGTKALSLLEKRYDQFNEQKISHINNQNEQYAMSMA